MESLSLTTSLENFGSLLSDARTEGSTKAAQILVEKVLNDNVNEITNFLNLLEIDHTKIVFCPLLSFYNQIPFMMGRVFQFVFNKSTSPLEVYLLGAFGPNNEIEIMKNGDADIADGSQILFVLDKKKCTQELVEILRRDYPGAKVIAQINLEG